MRGEHRATRSSILEFIRREINNICWYDHLKVQYYGEDHILHLEFESGEDAQLLSRLLVYNAVLYRDHQLPVLTIVIYPFKVQMVVPPLHIANRQKSILTFDVQTLPLFTTDAETYVEQLGSEFFLILWGKLDVPISRTRLCHKPCIQLVPSCNRPTPRSRCNYTRSLPFA